MEMSGNLPNQEVDTLCILWCNKNWLLMMMMMMQWWWWWEEKTGNSDNEDKERETIEEACEAKM